VWAIARADVLVFGGGTLFTDHESLHACFLWYSYAFLARFFRVPVVLTFQGVGPFQTWIGRFLTATVFRVATFISVRDERSFERVLLFQPSVSVLQTTDPVFPSLAHLFSSEKIDSSLVVLIPRGNSTPSFFESISSLFHQGCRRVAIILFSPDDRPIVEKILSSLPVGISYSVHCCATASELLPILAPASVVLTQRYHGALAGLSLGKKTIIIPQVEGEKLDALRQSTHSSEEIQDLFVIGEKALKNFFRELSEKKSS
jgi:polysaccharide pyruvyl transferase WcaK-like protein